MSKFLCNCSGGTYFHQTILFIHSFIHLFNTPLFSSMRDFQSFHSQYFHLRVEHLSYFKQIAIEFLLYVILFHELLLGYKDN